MKNIALLNTMNERGQKRKLEKQTKQIPAFFMSRLFRALPLASSYRVPT